MKTYVVSYASGVKKDFKKISREAQIGIVTAISQLTTDPRPSGAKKLADSQYYRIRVGDYKVIYDIHDEKLTILVVEVGHRREIYR